MPELTVIVPFFDERPYLRTALSSVLGQCVGPVQVIVVNDNPGRFSARDMAELGVGGPVELVQHPRNLGLSAARNSGLDRAGGRFVAFLDADDYYTLNGLARQLDLARETGADITHAPTWYSLPGNPEVRLLARDAALFAQRRSATGLLQAQEAQFITSSWSSLYLRDFLTDNRLRFDEHQPRFEDRLFVLQTVTRARNIAFLGEPTRVWRGRGGSISVSRVTPETRVLQVQLLEKCLAHMRAEVAAGHLPQRFEKRELFNTVSRLIWDMDAIDALDRCHGPLHDDLARRIPALLGGDSFGQAIFGDAVIRKISRVGARSRKGLITRAAFFAIHKALREGDFAAARARIDTCAPAPAKPRASGGPRPQGRRLILHLGMHKTGSTHIQHHLLRHAGRLRDAGILVPATGFPTPGRSGRDGVTRGHQGLVSALRCNDAAPWQALAREIAEAGAGTVILTCENLLFPTLPGRERLIGDLADRLAGFKQVDLVALARRPDTQAEAFYRERVAGGARSGSGGIGAFLVDHGAALTDFPGLFAPFEAAFATPVRFADFDALRGDRLWSGFAALAGLPAGLEALEAPRYRTPDRDCVLLLDLVNALVSEPDRRAAILQAWFALHPEPAAEASLLAPADRLTLLDMWQAQSAGFAAARGYAPDLVAARTALQAETWTPPEAIRACDLADLNAIAAQSAMPSPGVATHAPRTGKPTGGDMSLTIRLRPWAAGLIRKVRRRSG